MRKISSGFWLLATGFFLAGCTANGGGPETPTTHKTWFTQWRLKPEGHASKEMQPVTGEGKVLSVDQTLGDGTMEVKGETVRFWWQNQLRFGAQGVDGVALQRSPEAQTVPVAFNAEVGDWVAFKGYKMQGEIYVTGARVIRK